MDRRQGFLEDKLDVPELERDANAFIVSLIPYEETTTYKKGTRLGPEAIVEASGHIELMDETLRIEPARRGVRTVRPKITDLASITAHARELFASSGNALVGFLGGEHAITPALVAGLGRTDIGVVWIDAHADLRSEFHGRPDNHACAAYNTLPFATIVQVGIRSLCTEEIALLDGSDRVHMFQEWAGAAREAIEALPDTVYVSIDLDAFTPELMRAVGTPEPGGLGWNEMMDILDFTFRRKTVRAYDVVELCPDEQDVVSSYTAARLVYKVMAYHAHHKLEGRP